MKRRAATIAGAGLAMMWLSGAAPTTRLDVGVENLRNAHGLVRICLTADADNFPACVDDANAVTRTIPASAHMLRFEALPRGTYAIAVIHDENGNAKLDTIAGIPKEGFGFSRNPRILFGPPRFVAARFALEGDAVGQQVKMRYLL